MPRPAHADGPWGEAIRHWLKAREWVQADLVRAIQDAHPGSKIKANTISNAALGRDCRTSTLRQIADALQVPFEEVLVSPNRRSANEERKQLIIQAVEAALRADVRQTPAEAFVSALNRDRREKAEGQKSKPSTVTGKVRRKK